MRIPTRSALIGLVLASSVSGALVPAALAKDFYTRKRIDGRWVEGEFPKKGSQAERDQAAQPVAPPAQAAVAAPAAPAASTPFTLGLHFAPPAQPAAPNPADANLDVATGSIRERPSRRNVAPREKRAQSERRVNQEKVRDAETKAAPRPAAQTTTPAVTAAAPAEPRFASLSAPAEKPADPAPDPTKRLADALTAKAAALATGVITSAGDPIPQPKAEPASVNYDYKTGIKTVIYANGTMEEEPFDPATMKALATSPAR
jgi:hypothetical protein